MAVRKRSERSMKSLKGFLSKKEEVKIFHMYLCAINVLIGTRARVPRQSDRKKLQEKKRRRRAAERAGRGRSWHQEGRERDIVIDRWIDR